jgi:hypothetical protein
MIVAWMMNFARGIESLLENRGFYHGGPALPKALDFSQDAAGGDRSLFSTPLSTSFPPLSTKIFQSPEAPSRDKLMA